MEAIQALTTRRSCRSFKQEQIKDEELKTILDCGLNAPSGKNKQSSKIVVVQNQEEIKELSKLNAIIFGKDVDPFYGAPTVCFIFVPKDESNGIKDGSLVIGAMQTGAYAYNLDDNEEDNIQAAFHDGSYLPYEGKHRACCAKNFLSPDCTICVKDITKY